MARNKMTKEMQRLKVYEYYENSLDETAFDRFFLSWSSFFCIVLKANFLLRHLLLLCTFCK